MTKIPVVPPPPLLLLPTPPIPTPPIPSPPPLSSSSSGLYVSEYKDPDVSRTAVSSPPLQATKCPGRTGDSCSECFTSFSFLPGQYISSTAEIASPFYRSEHWTSYIPRLSVVFFLFLPRLTKVNSSHGLAIISCLSWQCARINVRSTRFFQGAWY